jgi:hypothetical protein
MVQVLVLPDTKLDGWHTREDRVNGGDKVREAVRVLVSSVAVITAFSVVVTVLAAAVNVALEDPAETAIDAGIMRTALSSLSQTLVFEEAV